MGEVIYIQITAEFGSYFSPNTFFLKNKYINKRQERVKTQLSGFF